jgi:hypothetical protein
MTKTVRAVRAFSLVGVGLMLPGAGALGCADPGPELEEQSGAIQNGTVVTTNSYGVVAVYHRYADTSSSAWYDHPCTGIVLNPSTGWESIVLTARHCVTPYANPNDGIDGPPLGPDRIRVTAELSPGPNPPPANAVAPCNLDVPPTYVPTTPGGGYLGLNETLDLALLYVCNPIPGLGATSTPLYMGSTGDLLGDSLTMYGYGIGSGTDNTTAGILRSSKGHQITDWVYTSPGDTGYDYNGYDFSDGTNGTYLLHGDSGGPSFWQQTNSLRVQIGVHQRGGASGYSQDTSISRITNTWIQSSIGRLYIRPHNAMSMALTRSSLDSGASVKTATTSYIDSHSSVAVRQYFQYEFSSRHIRAPLSVDGNTCLRRNSDNSLQMLTCSSTSSYQKWWVTDQNTIRTSDMYCLQRQSDDSLIVAPCDDTNKAQKWYFDYDSRAANVW